MHCFYCGSFMEKGGYLELDKAEHRHLFKTLRARTGEQIELTDGKGSFGVARVVEHQKIELLEAATFPEPARKLILFLAPPKKQKMDQLLKQCAEIGVWEIVPFISERSVSTPAKESTVERWRQLLLAGCKQSKNPFLPKISLPLPFNELFNRFDFSVLPAYFGAVSGENISFAAQLGKCGWFVGPEGGFTRQEEQMLCEHGIAGVKLGSYVLRVETAAVVGAAMLLNS